MRWEPKTCHHCGLNYNGASGYHSCKDVREQLERTIFEWKEKYVELYGKFQNTLRLCRLPELQVVDPAGPEQKDEK